ncbi:MAG: hypothetical protein KGL39_17020 [Patescibacteria group bacterium]|nr:hypothetical protein [Patescibacteria group bacterium]
MKSPTPRQSEILAWITSQIAQNGVAPTYREIGKAFQIRSPNGVMCHLRALEAKGMIRRSGKRGVVLGGPVVRLPYAGRVS